MQRPSEENPFELESYVGPAATELEIDASWNPANLPPALVDFWLRCGSARLGEDLAYGQWGLVLLSPPASAARTAAERRERPDDIEEGDVVLGEFIGDLELVIVNSAGAVLIAEPIYDRSEWSRIEEGLQAFLERYVRSGFEKYWEI